MDGDASAMQGAAQLLFYEGGFKKLPEVERVRWAVRYGEFVLNGRGTSEKIAVLRRLDKVGTSETLDLLRKVAAGEAGTEAPWNRDCETYAHEPGTRATACLLLAMRHDAATERLAAGYAPTVTNRADRIAVEIAAALAGKPHRVRGEHFELRNGLTQVAAAQVAEEHPSHIFYFTIPARR